MKINIFNSESIKKHAPQQLKELVKLLIRKKRVFITHPKVKVSPPLETPQKSPYSFYIKKDNFLEKLGEKYKPTKRLHNYLVYYWHHLRDIREKVDKVMEIGVQSDRSIKMWEEFFPNATIYGVDIDPACLQFEGNRRKILIGDQGDSNFYRKIFQETDGGIDIIIDDGSHIVEHQLQSFNRLFPILKDNGIYVIEDTGGCVEDQELVTVNAMKKIIDHIMFWPKNFNPKEWEYLSEFPNDSEWLNKNVIGIAFYRWIVFIMRGRNPQCNQYLKLKNKSE